MTRFWMLCVVVALWATPASWAAEYDWLRNGVVGIAATSEGVRKTGTGVVVRVDAQGVVVVTAAHVVEGDARPLLSFHGDPARSFEASILLAQGGAANGLALLHLPTPPGLTPTALRFDDDDADYIGEPAAVIGFPANAGLAWAVTKGSVIGQKGTELVFSGTVNEGNSGGPLVVKGLVAGIVASATPLEAFVVPPTIVRLFLKGSGLDVASLAAAAAGGDAETGATAWANVAGAQWVTFRVSRVDYLPPIADQFGEPDFVLFARTDSGRELFGHEVNTKRAVITGPQPATVLDGANRITLQILEDDSGLFGGSFEVISKPLTLPVSSFKRSNKVRLVIDPKLYGTYPELDPDKASISFRFQLERFDPEGESGPDASPAAPADVAAGRFVADRVDFDERDATDHLRLVAAGDTVNAILWVETKSPRFLEALGARGSTAITTLRQDGDDTRSLLQVVRGGPGAVAVRVLADRPGAWTRYRLFVLDEEDPVRGYLGFLDACLMQAGDAGRRADWCSGARPEDLALLRKHFKVPMHDQVLRIDALLDPLSESRLQAVAPVLESEFDEVRRAVGEARAQLKVLPAVVAVLGAERGRSAPDEDIEAALQSTSAPIVVRAIRIVGKSNRQDWIAKALPRFLLDDRPDVNAAARAVLAQAKWRP